MISGLFMTSTITQLRHERPSLILMQAIGSEGRPWGHCVAPELLTQ
jgi:hypothetical protein